MIKRFIDKVDRHRDTLRAKLATGVDDYSDIVDALVEILALEEPDQPYDIYDYPDPERITSINDGDYQGTLVFVVAAQGYQPSTYWATSVSYGSCSGCDTLQAIQSRASWDDDGLEQTTQEMLDDYVTLAMHLLNEFRQITGYAWEEGQI